MAKGDITIFSDFLAAQGTVPLDLDALELRVALVSDPITSFPKTLADPRFGIGGTTDVSATEVSGTNYTAGGNIAANPSYTETGNVVTYDADNPATWLQDPSGPNNIKTAILYLNDANDYAIGAMDLTEDGGTTPISMISGDVAVGFGAGGIYTVTN